MKLIPKQLRDRLAEMVGKSYVYQGKSVRVLQARIAENTVEIVTEGGWLTYPIRAATQELEKFVLAPENTLIEVKPVSVALYESNGAMQAMRESVLEMILKLKVDSSVVPQANAINGLLQTAIAMGKMELDAAKLNWQMREAALSQGQKKV